MCLIAIAVNLGVKRSVPLTPILSKFGVEDVNSWNASSQLKEKVLPPQNNSMHPLFWTRIPRVLLIYLSTVDTSE